MASNKGGGAVTTPIDSLIDALEKRKAQDIKVVSIDFVLNAIARQREFYPNVGVLSEKGDCG